MLHVKGYVTVIITCQAACIKSTYSRTNKSGSIIIVEEMIKRSSIYNSRKSAHLAFPCDTPPCIAIRSVYSAKSQPNQTTHIVYSSDISHGKAFMYLYSRSSCQPSDLIFSSN